MVIENLKNSQETRVVIARPKVTVTDSDNVTRTLSNGRRFQPDRGVGVLERLGAGANNCKFSARNP